MNEASNTRIVQETYAAFARGDFAAILDLLAEDVEMHIPGAPTLPLPGARRGRQAVAEFFTLLHQTLEFDAMQPREYIAQGDTVVALGRYRSRVRVNGRIFDNEWAAVIRLRDGKISGFRMYEDTATVAAAFCGD